MRSRDQLFLPLAVGIFALLASNIPAIIKLDPQFMWGLLVAGGLLLGTFLGFWRWISHYTDENIVNMYLREVQLEKQLGYIKRSKYIYEHLSCRSKKLLATMVDTDFKISENWRYDQFEDKIRSCPLNNTYDCLILVLQTYGYKSVISRGHHIWDLAALSIFVLWWITPLLIWWIMPWLIHILDC